MDAWTPDDLKVRLDKGERVFLKLWKKGCGICKLSVPATEKMEKDNPYQLVFGKICIDEFPEMMDVAGTEVLPVFFIFDQKKKKGMFTGFKGLQKLEEFVTESLNG